MSEVDDKINELESRLKELLKTQISFQEKTNQIRYEIGVLRATVQKQAQSGEDKTYRQPVREPVVPRSTQARQEPTQPRSVTDDTGKQTPPSLGQHSTPRRDVPPPNFGYTRAESQPKEPKTPSGFSRWMSEYAESARANLEEFIGENLISKIGILILLIGIGIGVKYSIDNNLISPLTRVIFGYIFGFGLTALAIRMKRKYHNFSAVLLSGGMAAMYFVTYFGYSLYGLMGQLPAFGLMVMFTVLTVTAALVYNRQVIAHIGLVGSYAVPFLLSNNSGAYAVLFTYVAIINLGILAISIKREWRPVFYTSSVFTWLIFVGWFATKYTADHFYLALLFLWLFFAIFYAANLALVRKQGGKIKEETLVAAAATCSIFYGFCIGIVLSLTNTAEYNIFFTYLAAATLPILVTSSIESTSAKDSRKLIFYVASAFIWIIFYIWLANSYVANEHFAIALTTLGVFFAMFYGARVVQGLRFAETGAQESLLSVLATVFISYAFALAISDGEFSIDRYAAIFSFLAVITLAVLIVSLRYYGRAVVYVAYPATWLIFGVWFLNHYQPEQHFVLAAVFASLFFAIFYVTTLVIRLMFDDMNVAESAGLMLTNSFVFYGFGYSIMGSRGNLQAFQGLYTISHALFHLGVWQFARRVRSSAADVGNVLVVLILTFATIAVPVQFDGNRITMIWAVEGALLFWIARLRQVRVFEYFSYPVMALAVGGLFFDWTKTFIERISVLGNSNPQPFANGDFVTALIFLASFGFIFITNRNERYTPTISASLVKPIGYLVATIGLFVLYNTFRIEIGNHFHILRAAALAGEPGHSAGDLFDLNIVWQIIYSMLFFAALNVVNLKWLRSGIFHP